jgi:hypothetical protein
MLKATIDFITQMFSDEMEDETHTSDFVAAVLEDTTESEAVKAFMDWAAYVKGERTKYTQR